MKIDIEKVKADLATIRHQMGDLRKRVETLATKESQLVAFIEMAETYSDDKPRRVTPRVEPTEKPPLETESLESVAELRRAAIENFQPSNRTRVARAIADTFATGSVLTARDLANKTGLFGDMNLQKLATLLVFERGKDGILRHIGPGQYIVRPDAARIAARRYRAEAASVTQFPPIPDNDTADADPPAEKDAISHRTLIAKAIVERFAAGTTITARDVADAGNLPEWAQGTRLYQLAAIMAHERQLPDSVLERIDVGKYMIKADAAEIIARRLNAEAKTEGEVTIEQEIVTNEGEEVQPVSFD